MRESMKRFSVPVTAWGLQAGYEGKIILKKLRQEVLPSYFIEAERETRTNLKVVDERTKQTTELNEAGFTPSNALLEEFVRRFESKLDRAPIVAL